MLLVLMTAAGCGAPAGGDALSPSSPTPQSPGPLVLQTPPTDVSGPFYTARTDGPEALVVTFVGAPEGDGPCNVAEYVGRLEPAGDDLRLVVEARHTGEQPDGSTACTAIGAHRQLRVELDEPLAGRRVVDEQGHLLSLVDGDQLLRFSELPSGWTEGPEGQNVGGPVAWSLSLHGPRGVRGELRQGSPELTTVSEGSAGFGYREIDRPTVRGVEAVLASFDAEQPGNHVLTWVEGDRGYALQAMGPLPDPEVLVEIANGLRG